MSDVETPYRIRVRIPPAHVTDWTTQFIPEYKGLYGWRSWENCFEHDISFDTEAAAQDFLVKKLRELRDARKDIVDRAQLALEQAEQHLADVIAQTAPRPEA